MRRSDSLIPNQLSLTDESIVFFIAVIKYLTQTTWGKKGSQFVSQFWSPVHQGGEILAADGTRMADMFGWDTSPSHIGHSPEQSADRNLGWVVKNGSPASATQFL